MIMQPLPIYLFLFFMFISIFSLIFRHTTLKTLTIRVGLEHLHLRYFLFTHKLSNEISQNYVHKYYTQTHLQNFHCINIIELEVISHFPNKHNSYFSE